MNFSSEFARRHAGTANQRGHGPTDVLLYDVPGQITFYTKQTRHSHRQSHKATRNPSSSDGSCASLSLAKSRTRLWDCAQLRATTQREPERPVALVCCGETRRDAQHFLCERPASKLERRDFTRRVNEQASDAFGVNAALGKRQSRRNIR